MIRIWDPSDVAPLAAPHGTVLRSLRELRDWVEHDPAAHQAGIHWDGLLHQSVRWWPGSDADASSQPDHLDVSLTSRAGIAMLRARMWDEGSLRMVEHRCAYRLPERESGHTASGMPGEPQLMPRVPGEADATAAHGAAGTGADATHSASCGASSATDNGHSTTDSASSASDSALSASDSTSCAPHSVSSPADSGTEIWQIMPEHVALWVETIGDPNALHSVPGSGHTAGLPIGAKDLLLPGTLMLALYTDVLARQAGHSAPCDPSTTHLLQLRFLHPVGVPLTGVVLRVTPGVGISVGSRLVVAARHALR